MFTKYQNEIILLSVQPKQLTELRLDLQIALMLQSWHFSAKTTIKQASKQK